jgi:hypothetical protein
MSAAITVTLVGGLGNQLFAYYAGSALAQHRQVGLVVDTTWAAHGVSIRSFELDGRWIDPPPAVLSPLWGRSSVGYRALSKALRSSRYTRDLLRIYDSPVIGHDPGLLKQPTGSRIRGYFQSWQLVAAAVEGGAPRRPKLREESSWLVRMRAEAEAEKPLMVHVRRGDYAQQQFGLLADPYYEHALKRLREHGLTGPVWVFSDEPERIPVGLRSGARFVTSPVSAHEDLVLMSHGGGNVIANSTFSWWGAWMNPAHVPVVYPDLWFQSGPRIEGLIPPWWIPEAAAWEGS